VLGELEKKKKSDPKASEKFSFYEQFEY